MISCDMHISTRIIFGPGKSSEIGSLLKEYKVKKLLLVYGGGSIKATGLYDRVINCLKEQNIVWKELNGVKSNPTLDKVNEGIQICRQEKIKFILAVGGGSVVDTAKGISIGTDYNGNVWDFFSGKAEVTQAIPVASILTIPGTASEISQNAVLTNVDTLEKIGIHSQYLRPLFSILDPELCLTIPSKQIGPSIYDALSHTMERYFTPTEHTDLSDGVAEGVMKALLKNGPIVHQDPSNLDAWAEVMVASDFAHSGITGFGRQGDWSNHPMEEEISGIYDIPHGAGLSVITPAWMRYVYKKHLPMFVQFAVNVMGVQGDIRNEERTALEGIDALEDYSRKLGLPLHLSEFGIDNKNFKKMADRIIARSKNGHIGSLEELKAEDIVNIYNLSL